MEAVLDSIEHMKARKEKLHNLNCPQINVSLG